MGALAFAYGVACYLAFLGSFAYLVAFVGDLPVPRTVSNGPAGPPGMALALDLALLALFGLQHSLMARPAFKRAWTRIVPPSLERSTYVLLSSLALALLFRFWRPLPGTVWAFREPALVLAAWIGFWGGVALTLLSSFMVSHLDLFGLRQAWCRFRGVPWREPAFRLNALYARTRHPLMLGFLVTFWSAPVMTFGRLVFALGCTGYILAGTQLEERDLLRALGPAYARYRAAVPRLLPAVRRRIRDESPAVCDHDPMPKGTTASRGAPGGPPILCLGEVVWDCYESGAHLGGAPFNVAVQLARHGVGAALLTAVGPDELGRRTLDFLREEQLPGARVHPRLPTGTVAVTLDPAGVPCFTIRGGCAWTDLEGAGTELPGRPAVLVFGGLAMHAAGNRRLLSRLLEAWGPGPVLLCDLNLRPGWSDPEVARWCLERCHYLKVNEDEARFLDRLAGPDWRMQPGLRGICTTLGPAGLVWREPGGAPLALPVLEGAPPVLDTVGAGDALTAAMAAGLAAGDPPAVFLERGRLWAAATCGVRGALPPRPG